MNFSSFGGHFSNSIPNIHQFAADSTNGVSSRYGNHLNSHSPIDIPNVGKFLSQVNNISSTPSEVLNNKIVYSHINNHYSNVPFSQNQTIQQRLATPNELEKQNYHQQSPDLLNQQSNKDKKSEIQQNGTSIVSNKTHQNMQMFHQSNIQTTIPTGMPASWQSLATPGSTVADYLSNLPASTLPLSLHHFLKYSAESIKKESELAQTTSIVPVTTTMPNLLATTNIKKKKKKKLPPKEKKSRPKPGEIRLTTALDGSTLYCCPECHMAYPQRELLEQHLLGHTLERRFICDICGAGLKRKDHLTRHKQSHNPERPYVCTVCLKAFKRKEQLTLHFVIHSGEKRHVCTECGKGFYRKDHLRKHTRSHLARRVKAELSQNAGSNLQNNQQSNNVSAVQTPEIISSNNHSGAFIS